MLDAVACVKAYRDLLISTYGRWERAEGSAHTPDGWFALLRDAVAQESTSVEQMVRLSAFALLDDLGPLTEEARAALAAPQARRVLGECQHRLQEQDLVSPAAAAAFFTDLRHALRAADGLRGVQVMLPIRAALTATLVGPCLGIVASLLGYRRAADRLRGWAQ